MNILVRSIWFEAMTISLVPSWATMHGPGNSCPLACGSFNKTFYGEDISVALPGFHVCGKNELCGKANFFVKSTVAII